MPIPSPADFRNKSKKHSEVREMLAQMAESAESKDDASTKANTAEANAKTYADTKKSEAISTASADATTKANAAQANAIATAATDATTKANAAEANAKADATAKANAAEANAKTYTDSKLPITSPLIDPVNNVQDLYVSVTTGNIFAETGSVINVFPVVGGQLHVVKSPSYDPFSFSIATRTTNSVATGATQGKVTLTDTIDPSIKTFTPPADAKYAFITVKKGVNFDISSTVAANLGTEIITAPIAKKIDGASVYDEQARIELVKKSELLNAQLYDPKNTFDGKYSRYDTGAIATAADYMMNVFPVTGGKTYIINASSYAPNFFSLSTRDTASVEVGATQGKVTLVDTTNANIKLFTVPETAKYAFITVKAGAGFDIRNSLQINEGTELITSEGISRINWKSLYDIDLRKRVVVLEKDVVNIASPLKNKKWGAYGDSITAASGCYAEILAARHSATLVKKAISGAKLHRNPSATEVIMSEVWDTDYDLPYEPDLITIAIGTNDYMGYNTLGVMTDRVSTTFYGALHLMIGGLRTKYANARIGFISQIPRDGIRISPSGTNPESLKQKAVKEVCEYYSIPLFESYAKFGFNPSDNSTMRTAMMPDGLHPNSVGHTWYANRVEDFILSLAK